MENFSDDSSQFFFRDDSGIEGIDGYGDGLSDPDHVSQLDLTFAREPSGNLMGPIYDAVMATPLSIEDVALGVKPQSPWGPPTTKRPVGLTW